MDRLEWGAYRRVLEALMEGGVPVLLPGKAGQGVVAAYNTKTKQVTSDGLTQSASQVMSAAVAAVTLLRLM